MLFLAFCITTICFTIFKLLPCCTKTKKRRPSTDQKMCAVVTGYSSGIGLATVKALYKDTNLKLIGIDVVEVDGGEIFKGLDTSSNINSRFMGFKCDVTKDIELKKVYETLFSKGFVVDAIICCAGITCTGPLMEINPNQIQKVMDINVMGVHRCVRTFFGLMKKGSIVIPILSEIAYAMQSSAFNAAYSMSKFALQAYVTALRQELDLVGVHVKGVYPGAIATKLSMNHTIDMTMHHIENNSTLFKNPLLQFVNTSKRYIHSNAKDPKYVANEIVEACLYETTSSNNILVNVSTMMKILKYLPQSIMDFGTNKMLRATDDNYFANNSNPMLMEKKYKIIHGWRKRINTFDELYNKLHDTNTSGLRVNSVDLRE